MQTPALARRALDDSHKDILNFINANTSWVIEGCYSDLIEYAVEFSTELIFMNIGVELCSENAKTRPWEPHKYESKEAQDQNLAMLLNWIAQVPNREDSCCKVMHEKLYDEYPRKN